MKLKNHLDEMQEQELLKIEHNGCWLTFWLLPLSVIVQRIAFPDISMEALAGEWVVFMVLSLYLAAACVRKGIWDRRIPMTGKANFLLSLIAALIVGIFNATILFRTYHMPLGSLGSALITAIFTFILCFAALSLLMTYTKKRRTAMDAEPEDTDTL